MNENIQQLKPTAYLDQNLLDLFLKYPELKFEAELVENYHVVYSDETLKEIKRSSNREFLSVLSRLEARYLKVQLDGDFVPTGNAYILETNPFDTFDNYVINIHPVYEKMMEATTLSLHKFYGGQQGSSLDDLNDVQIDAFDGLMAHIREQAELLSKSSSDIKEATEKSTEIMSNQFNDALKLTTQHMRAVTTGEEDFSAVKEYRSVTGVGPSVLNNIKHPNVIQKIWDIHKELPDYRMLNLSIDQFLGIDSKIHPRPLHLYEKVTCAYNVLNLIGYFPDKQMERERKFVASMSDAGHASMASFCNVVLSNDNRFVTKAIAVYEYLGAQTRVINVKINKTEG